MADMPNPLVQAAAQAAARATEMRKSGAFSVHSSNSSVRSLAVSIKPSGLRNSTFVPSPPEVSTIAVQAPVSVVEQVVPVEVKRVEEEQKPAPEPAAIEEVTVATTEAVKEEEVVTVIVAEEETPKEAPKAVAEAPKVAEEVVEVVAVIEPPVEAPQVQITAEKPKSVKSIKSVKSVKSEKVTKATGRAQPGQAGKGLKSRVPASLAAKQTTTSKASPRPSIEKRDISRPGSRASTASSRAAMQPPKTSARPSIDKTRPAANRASSLRSESKVSIRPDSRAAKKTTLVSEKNLKAPSIAARSVNSVSSGSTGKIRARGGVDGKDKSRIDKLKKEKDEVK